MGEHMFFSICHLSFIWNLGFDLCHSNSFYFHIWTLLGVVIDYIVSQIMGYGLQGLKCLLNYYQLLSDNAIEDKLQYANLNTGVTIK